MNFLNSVIDFSSVIAHIVDTMTVSFYEAIFLSRRYMDSQYILFSILQILSVLAAVIAFTLVSTVRYCYYYFLLLNKTISEISLINDC